jgi:hypothetical protein
MATKQVLYRIEFEGAQEQVDNLTKIGDELLAIRGETKLLADAQKVLRANDLDLNKEQKARMEQLKVEGQIKQQLYRKEQQALKDQKTAHKAVSNTLQDLRIKARQLGKELESGPQIGSKEFKRLANELRDVNTKIQQADKSAGNFKSSIGNYRDALSGLGGALGVTLSAGAAIAGTRELIRAFDDQIKAETALLTAAKGRKDVQQDLIKQAGELQRKTLFGDEQIIQVQSYAAAMGLTRGQIEKLIPAALNLSTVTGMDLQASVKNLAKTYSGLSGELGEAVPALRGLTAEEMKAGKAIDLVNKLMAGQAEAAALVGSGSITQATNAWGDFKEILGELISTNTSGFFRSLTDELYTLNNTLNSDVIPTWQKWMSLLIPSLRAELDIKNKIAEQRKEEIGASNKERIEALDLGWQKINAQIKELEQRKKNRAEAEKLAALEQKRLGMLASAAAQKALAAELKLLQDIGAQLEKNASSNIKDLLASGMTGNTQQQSAEALANSRRGWITVDEEENVDDPFNTEAVAAQYDIQTKATQSAAASYSSIWADAFSQREEALKESLENGSITEREYQKESEKLQKQQANLNRTMAIAQLTADMARSLSALGVGAANTAKIGFPQNIPALIGFAAQAVGIISNLKGIKFAEGGLIAGGRPHSQGGTKFVGSDGSAFEAEQGEYIAVVNKHDTPRLRQLSDINSRHGRSFYGQPAGSYFATGGIFQPNQNIGSGNQEALIRAMVSQIGSIPVEVSLNEIESKSSLKRKVNVIGSL